LYRKLSKNIYPYLFVSPYMILFFVFALFPVVYSFILSFTKWDGFSEMTFVGAQNYLRLFSDKSFYVSLVNTLLIIIVAIPLQLGTALLLAVILKQFFTGKLQTGLKLMNFLPYITTPVAIAVMFQLLFDWQVGAVNLFLLDYGIMDEAVNWLGETWGARFVIILLVYWKYYGYQMVIIFAGLTTISREIYEAASIDGASWSQAFLKITVPLLKPVLMFLIITDFIGGFQLFDEPQLLFNQPFGGPEQSVLTIVMHYYDTAFRRFEFGYGSSIAYGLFLIIFVFSLATLKLMNRGTDQ